MIYTFLFTRQESFALTAAAELTLESSADQATAYKMFRHAVTTWATETQRGREIAAAVTDFNIGDLMLHNVPECPEFVRIASGLGLVVRARQIDLCAGKEFDSMLIQARQTGKMVA